MTKENSASFRIHRPIFERISERAKQDNRTITATIEIALIAYLRNDNGDKK